jgi:hypothetical protein
MPAGKHNSHIRGDKHWKWRGGPNAAHRRANAYASSKKYPEKRRARERVKDAIRREAIPPAKALNCVDCGQPANQYDHPRGYENALDIEPVCYKCHGARSRQRGEHKRPKPM